MAVKELRRTQQKVELDHLNNYEVWISWNNQEDIIRLPVNPASIEVSNGSNGSTYNIEKLGEINVIKSPSLLTYSFDGVFPARYHPAMVAPLLDPTIVNGIKFNAYVYYFKKWMESKRPIRFVVIGPGYGINTACSIESFTWRDVAGSGGDIAYSLSLKRYQFYGARKVKFTETDAGKAVVKDKPERPNEKQPPSTYTLVKGDTLWDIAKKKLGSGDRWREVQKLNNIKDAEVKKLQIGRVLKLP
ncbi:LysM peptidoglycan-binding domain-containing protein [Paenibacillaceae bacterium]|nr:LysM peptidoglycan-binding domain-containing protein [Paenibacillaceae bacterium]